jgi:hypothetical protein
MFDLMILSNGRTQKTPFVLCDGASNAIQNLAARSPSSLSFFHRKKMLHAVLATFSSFTPVQHHALQSSRATMSSIVMQMRPDVNMMSAPMPPMQTRGWSIDDITPDGQLAQRVEGSSRRMWNFDDISRDRVHIAAVSEGRPINTQFQLWIGPDWTPFTLEAYTEDGLVRPIQTLIGTRNKQAVIETQNRAVSGEFPYTAAADYGTMAMAELPYEFAATTPGKKVDGGALSSFTVDADTQQLELMIKTDGRQLNARIEVLAGPNNPKQTYEVMTQNGELNCLCVSMNLPGAENTVRIVNLATIEFPCYIHRREFK